MVLPGDFSVQLAVSPCHTLTTEAGEGILPHLPHPSGSLPRWPFLSSSIRFFTQLLPRQLWGLEHPLGIGVTLSTRPEKGWVTTSKHQFLKERDRWRLRAASPPRQGPVPPSVAFSKSPSASALPATAWELLSAQRGPHFLPPLGTQGAAGGWVGAGGSMAEVVEEQVLRVRMGRSVYPSLLVSKSRASEEALRETEGSNRDSRSRQRAVPWPLTPGRRQFCHRLCRICIEPQMPPGLRRGHTWGLARTQPSFMTSYCRGVEKGDSIFSLLGTSGDSPFPRPAGGDWTTGSSGHPGPCPPRYRVTP